MGAKQSRKKLQRQINEQQQKEVTLLRELNDQHKEVTLLREQLVERQISDLQEQLDRNLQQQLDNQQKEVMRLREQLDRFVVKLADLQANTTPNDYNNVRQEPNHSSDTQLTVTTPKEQPGNNSNNHDGMSGDKKPEPLINNQGQGRAVVTATLCPMKLFPLIPYPKPQSHLWTGAQQAEIDAYSTTVHVQQNWTPKELNEIVKDLPDHKVDVERWCAAILDLIEMYEPSARELESVFCKVFGLKWLHLREHFDVNGAQHHIVTGQLLNHGGLFDRVKATFPARTDWPKIHGTKQRPDETCDTYRNRLENCFQKHCGVPLDNPAYNDLLKTFLINGLLPAFHNYIIKSCIGWENRPLTEVWGHALHAERNTLSQDFMKKKKLEAAQLMFYETHRQQPLEEQRQRRNQQSHRSIRSREWKQRKGGNSDPYDRAAICHYRASDDHEEEKCSIKRRTWVNQTNPFQDHDQYGTGPVPFNHEPGGNAAAYYLQQGGPNPLHGPTSGSMDSIAIWTR